MQNFHRCSPREHLNGENPIKVLIIVSSTNDIDWVYPYIFPKIILNIFKMHHIYSLRA